MKTPFEIQQDTKQIFLESYLKDQEQKKRALEKFKFKPLRKIKKWLHI